MGLAAALSMLFAGPVQADQDFDIQDHEGKVVLLDFWASWCGPCKQSFPWMNEMHSKYKDQGLVIVAVNLDNEPSAAEQFLLDQPAEFIVHFDEQKSLARQFEVEAMPSSFLIGRDGELIESKLGFKVSEKSSYETAIRTALATEH